MFNKFLHKFFHIIHKTYFFVISKTEMAPRKSGLTRATRKKHSKTKCTSQPVLEVGEGSNADPDREITQQEPPKKKGRGPGKIRKSTDVVEDRPIIWPVGDCEFTCNLQSGDCKPKDITAVITRYKI